jgi:hypothetical protein
MAFGPAQDAIDVSLIFACTTPAKKPSPGSSPEEGCAFFVRGQI